ncbi:MAG: trehalose-6-phosphate synthase, partial [Candidatus Sulfotelmatobacter sp.]
MRLLSVRLIVSLIVGITLVSLGFSYYEVVGEKRALRSDLERRAEVIGESVAGNVEKSWENGSERGLQRLVQRFGSREHLLGIAVYDHKGKLVAITSELGEVLTAAPPNVAQVIAQDSEEGFFGRLGNNAVHILAVPLHREDETVGALLVVHDVSYIRAQTLHAWRQAFLRVLVQMFLIVFITLLIVRWSIAGPIARAAQWMRALRMGRISSRQQMPDLDLFRPLAREVVTLTESLSQARNAAENEARLREASQSMWTADRLAVQIQTRLDGGRIFVVSNREPYTHQRNGKSIEVVVPPSGLVSALEPILDACDGTWIAHGSGDADAEVVDNHDRLRVPVDDPRYTLRRVWLSKEEE